MTTPGASRADDRGGNPPCVRLRHHWRALVGRRVGAVVTLGAIALHDLTVSYRGHPAVHHLSGQFRPGALTAVVGPNGAGKSTLLGALAGAIRGFEGTIEGDPALRIAYLPQASDLDRSFPVRVYEVVATGLWPRIGSFGWVRPADRARIGEALNAVGLTGFEQRLLGELSAGQAQRMLFGRVLVVAAR